MKNNEINEVLHFDALHEAEKITGKSYKEDKATEALGFLAHINNSERKNKMLKEMGDSQLSNTEKDYLQIVETIGFKSILVEPFVNESGIEERLHIMWNDEYSILLVFDTFTWGDDGSWAKSGQSAPPPSINGGHFYYNWSPNKKEYNTRFLSSGRFVNDNVWSGHHDCREAIKFNISQLIENGSFVKQWKETPFLWLLHYMDTKVDGYDYKKINRNRLSKLPKNILKAINYESHEN